MGLLEFGLELGFLEVGIAGVSGEAELVFYLSGVNEVFQV